MRYDEFLALPKGLDLTGWRLMNLYSMALSDGLEDYFPELKTKVCNSIVHPSKQLMEEIFNKFGGRRDRNSHFCTSTVLINETNDKIIFISPVVAIDAGRYWILDPDSPIVIHDILTIARYKELSSQTDGLVDVGYSGDIGVDLGSDSFLEQLESFEIAQKMEFPLDVNQKLTSLKVSQWNEMENGFNLNNWQLSYCYSLKLVHGLMGHFPAIDVESNDTVFTFDKKVISDVWKSLSPRESRLCKSLALVNVDSSVAIGINILEAIQSNRYFHDDYKDPELMYSVKSKKDYDLLCQKHEQPFKWAPGLISNDMKPEEFMETLQAALK